MRFEATIPDSRGAAVLDLAAELGLSRSQLIDEALALFMKVVMEVRRGRRLVTMEAGSSQPACELSTQTLSAFEWAARPQRLVVDQKEVERMHELSTNPPEASASLKAAVRRHRA